MLVSFVATLTKCNNVIASGDREDLNFGHRLTQMKHRSSSPLAPQEKQPNVVRVDYYGRLELTLKLLAALGLHLAERDGYFICVQSV